MLTATGLWGTIEAARCLGSLANREAVQVRRLISIIKPEFATVRQLEMKGYGLFKWAGIIGAVSFGAFIFVGLWAVVRLKVKGCVSLFHHTR